jgi:D-aspartate ligase
MSQLGDADFGHCRPSQVLQSLNNSPVGRASTCWKFRSGQLAMSISPHLDTTVPVLLLKIGTYVIHHGAVGIARSLGRLGVPVYAMVEDRYTPLAVCRHLTRAFINRTDGTNDLLNWLAGFGERMRRPTILLPTDDNGAVFIAEHKKALSHWFLFPDLPAGLPRQLADKMSLLRLCREVGVACPAYAVPRSMDEVHEFIERATFPVVVKSGEHFRRLSNGYSSFVVRSPRELIEVCGSAESFQYTKIVLQEYVPGEDWIFHGYRNHGTDCFVGFTGKKLRSYPPFAGPTSLGVSILNERLTTQVEVMLSAIGYSGIMDIDCRRDERDGRYKFLDFNPRVGANFRMFENHEGIDVVRALHLDLTGRAVRASSMVEGRTFIVELHDLVASLTYLRQGGLTVQNWWRSLSGKRELAWWSWGDPLPFLAMSTRVLLRASGRIFRTGWEQLKTLAYFGRRAIAPYRTAESK